MRQFIKFEDRKSELVKDDLAVDYDWYELKSFYNPERKFKELDNRGEKYVIKSIQYLKVKEPRLYAFVSVLKLLENTNCGHCDAPWLSNEIFDDLVAIVKEYIEDEGQRDNN